MSKPTPVSDRLDELGIEFICEEIASGKAIAELSRELGISKTAIKSWIAADKDRSARAKDARQESAEHWDNKAEEALLNADTESTGAVSIARELASHYRWRSKVRDPINYGEKLAHTDADGGPLTIKIVQFGNDNTTE